MLLPTRSYIKRFIAGCFNALGGGSEMSEMTDGLVTRWTVPLALHAGDPFSLMLLHSFTPAFKRGAALFSGERQSPGDRAGNEPISAASDPGDTASSRSEPGAA